MNTYLMVLPNSLTLGGFHPSSYTPTKVGNTLCSSNLQQQFTLELDLLENAEHLLSGAPASYTTGNRLPDDISPYSFTSTGWLITHPFSSCSFTLNICTEDYHNSASVELPSITVPSKGWSHTSNSLLLKCTL